MCSGESVFVGCCVDSGTGSRPPACQGWQRPTRRSASQLPRSAPWRSTAVSAYSEQVGVKRQWLPSQGLTTSRYVLISRRSSVRMRGNCTPVVVQCADYLLVAAFADTRAHQHNQVKASELRLAAAETFPDQALYPVAFDRVAGRLDRNHGAQAGTVQAIGGCQQRNQAVTGLVLAVLENSLVLGCSEQAAIAGITRRHKQPGKRGSDRQACATLGATCLDDKTAILRAHPGTKSVVALALQVAGLKSSLHGAIDSQKQLKASSWAGRIRPRRLLVLPRRCQPLRAVRRAL